MYGIWFKGTLLYPIKQSLFQLYIVYVWYVYVWYLKMFSFIQLQAEHLLISSVKLKISKGLWVGMKSKLTD